MSNSIVFTAGLAKDVLYLTAFPLLTALYGYRGLDPATPSKDESKVARWVNLDPDTLNQWYSLLVPLGFVLTKQAALELGLSCMVVVGEKNLNISRVYSLFEVCGDVGQFFTWASAVLGFGSLGIWCYQRYLNNTGWRIGAPEIALALYIPTFAYWWSIPHDIVLQQLVQEHVSTCSNTSCSFH